MPVIEYVIAVSYSDIKLSIKLSTPTYGAPRSPSLHAVQVDKPHSRTGEEIAHRHVQSHVRAYGVHVLLRLAFTGVSGSFLVESSVTPAFSNSVKKKKNESSCSSHSTHNLCVLSA